LFLPCGREQTLVSREETRVCLFFFLFLILILILCSSQSGDDYPENNLANFGYILDMKVGKIK